MVEIIDKNLVAKEVFFEVQLFEFIPSYSPKIEISLCSVVH